MMTIMASLEGADTDIRYTITVLSHVQFEMENQPQRGSHSKTVFPPKIIVAMIAVLSRLQVTGALTSRSSGGNHTYPTFMTNPQYRLQLRPNLTGEGSNENDRTPVFISAKGPRDLPLNVKVIWSNGQRVTE